MSHDRKAVVVDWPHKTIRIYPIGDVHVGSRACHEDKIKRLADIITNDDMGVVIGMGDFIEAITPGDRRFSPSELSKPISESMLDNTLYCQSLRFCKLFEKTKGKWVALVAGNHEQKAARMFYFNPMPIISERLGGCPAFPIDDQSGWIRIKMLPKKKHRGEVDIFAIHGWGGGALRGASALKTERLLYRKNADIMLMAHTHMPMAIPITTEGLDRRGHEKNTTRWGTVCFPLTGKHAYLASRGGNPSPPGYTVIQIDVRAGLCETSVRMYEL